MNHRKFIRFQNNLFTNTNVALNNLPSLFLFQFISGAIFC